MSMKAESKALFFLALFSFHGVLSLASLPDLKSAQIQQLHNVDKDLKANSAKLKEIIEEALNTKLQDTLTVTSIQAKFKDVLVDVSEAELSGLSSAKAVDTSVDLLNGRFSVTVHIPVIVVEGLAKIGGSINGNSVTSTQNLRLKIKNVRTVGKGKVDISNGLKIDELEFTSQTSESKMMLKSITGGDGMFIHKISQKIGKDLSNTILSNVNQMLVNVFLPRVSTAVAPLSHCSLATCSLEEHIHSKYVAEQRVNINSLVDEVLDVVSKMMLENGLDPMSLPDIGIEWTIFWFFTLKIGLFDGYIEGLSNMARASDWNMNVEGITRYSIDGVLAIYNLWGQYTWMAKYMGIGIDVDFAAEIAYVDVAVKFSFNIITCELILEVFDIQNIGHVEIHVNGIIFLNWLIDLIAEFIVNLMLELIVQIIESIVKVIFETALGYIDLCGKILPPIVK